MAYFSITSQVLYGTADPTSGIGQNGDWYIRQQDGSEAINVEYLYGPKAGGAWPSTPYIISRGVTGKKQNGGSPLTNGSTLNNPTNYAVTSGTNLPNTTDGGDGWQTVSNLTSDAGGAYCSSRGVTGKASVEKVTGGFGAQPVSSVTLAGVKVQTMPTKNTSTISSGSTTGSVVTINTVAGHGLTTGDRIYIQGCSNATYNSGIQRPVTVISSTQFTFNWSTPSGVASNGTVTRMGFAGCGSGGSLPYYACTDADGKVCLFGSAYSDAQPECVTLMASTASGTCVAGDIIFFKKEGILFTVIVFNGSTGAVRTTINAVVGGAGDQGGSQYFAFGSSGYLIYNDITARLQKGWAMS